MPRASVPDSSPAGFSTNHTPEHLPNHDNEDSNEFPFMILGSSATVLALTAGFDVALETLEENLEERGDPELGELVGGMQK
eukprot:CAMPEP_0172730794 /NCGR_PEP_ID=MMETSP1074-20121228/99235_1 /TAXON_ID=2916 /ORGANISM="Ceratium fusus, Strain PA161109" /LENGTH=80 /DNA_ID=CAMNT_0013558629 /DNA_START=182 /DNA_END=421 /DNA_ORIENTATION=+